MPRQRAPRTGMATRRFGIEMEGYVGTYPRSMNIQGVGIKRDASLYNSRWSSRGDKYGVEIVSRPIKTHSIVTRIFGEMSNYNWSTDERAGTHVHVEIDDFDEYEKMKLLRFCKGIERIMFMFVKDYRNGNRYCNGLHKEWRKIFRHKESEKLNILKGMMGTGNTFATLRSMGLHGAVNSKYYWCNVYGSQRPTVEFRLFHAVTSAQEALRFVKLANAIVDMVKNSTVEQLEFLIMSLYESVSPLAIAKNLYYAIGLDYEADGLPLVGDKAKEYMANKLTEKLKRHELKQGNRILEAV